MTTDARHRLATLSVEERNVLARRLAERRAPAPAAHTVRRLPTGGDTFPLSFAQQRFWFLCQLAPLNSAFNVGELNRLTGPLDITALRRALNELVRRHEILRTTFATADGRPVQRVAAALDLPLEIEDLSAGADIAAELNRRISNESLRPWNLEAGPLVRARLWRLAEHDHVFMLLAHHIVSDGWSKAVLVRELTELYRAFSVGTGPTLPEPPIQYADFAVWQHEWMKSPEAERQLAYWKRHMADPPVLQLPTEAASRSKSSGTHQWAILPDDLSQALRALSQREGVTLFMTLLAAMAVLLSRYSGQPEIVIGSPMANRTRPELEDLIGCFMNPMPLRVDAAGNPSFRALLARVREMCLGAFANQDVPFDVLVRTLQPRRDTGNAPLFQAMLLLHNFWKSIALSSSGLDCSGFRVDPAALRAIDGRKAAGDLVYPVALEVIEIGSSLLACFEYADEYESVLGRMPGHFRELLAGVVKDPDAGVRQVPILTRDERTALLGEWNHARRDYPRACAHQLFEARAAETPAALAVVMGDERLTYAELNARANRLARRLHAAGVGLESRVGILLDRSPRMYEAVLAVMKSGGAYVPLDPTYPADRLAFILQNAGTRTLISEAPLSDVVERLDGARGCPSEMVWIDDAADAGGDASNLEGGPHPANLAYVIYTSGSTGLPKGTMISHESLANAYHAWEETYRLIDGPRCHLQMASLSFDVFSGDLVRALCSGGTLVVAPHDLLFAPDQLYALMRREGVDFAEFVPVVLRDVLAYLEQTGQNMSFLRLLAAGSDTWYAHEYQKVRRLCGPDTRVINSYGVTETTIDSTWFESEDIDGDAPVPLGRAFQNTDLYVLDAFGQPAPVGVAGELYIGGVALARGYLDAPGQTAERFVPDPFSEVPGARMYKTGDLARYLSDGNLEFLGRMDSQVKLRGFRVEPGEIESVLASDPSVAQAVVIIREDRPGDKRLVGYVVPREGESPRGPQLRRLAKDRLPDYMVPSAIVVLDALPLTPNGKIDRRALPAPDGGRQAEDAFVAPRTELEGEIAAIWSDVLGLSAVSVEDNFFDLGGHSMLVVKLHARLKAARRCDLTVVDIFRYPTVSALARRLTGDDGRSHQAFGDEVRERTGRQREALEKRRVARAAPEVGTL